MKHCCSPAASAAPAPRLAAGAATAFSTGLAALVDQLVAQQARLTAETAAEILTRSEVQLPDVQVFVEEQAESYARRCVVRTEAFELLVLTWCPGQYSAAHDHAGSSCCMRVIAGRARELRFEVGTDGMALAGEQRHFAAGEVLLDTGRTVHSIGAPEDARELLVTLHVYLPPLPELRRYAVAPPNSRIAAAFARRPAPDTPTVAVVGSGFSGTMAAAQLMLQASHGGGRLHLVILEKHSSLGEGAAYRTPNDAHLLNVPAGRMSAWPQAAGDFVAWAQTRKRDVTPADFLPRNWYADYLRTQLFAVAEGAQEGVSAELRREEVVRIERVPPRFDVDAGGFELHTRAGSSLRASGLVLATGHRPPEDPFARRWQGSRVRYITDPWASLVLGSVRADEPVLVIGTGLTAIDVFLTLNQRPRCAPVIALSRRGLLPAVHTSTPAPAVDAAAWLAALQGYPSSLRARELSRALRRAVRTAEQQGIAWQAVIDGLRPHMASLWSSLSEREARHFLRHLRVFWEVHRHRTAPSIGAQVESARRQGLLHVLAGRVLACVGDLDGASVQYQLRGSEQVETLRAAWVVNCTGPGDVRGTSDPALQSLIRAGLLQPDGLGLGARTGPEGQAQDHTGHEQSDLLVVGTLRKADLWESTAVPELRAQAASAARVLWRHLSAERGAASTNSIHSKQAIDT